MSILNAVKLLARLKQLHDICLPPPDETGQAARWNALQEWLQLNPDFRVHLENVLQAEPEPALEYLLTALGLDKSMITQFDPRKELQGQAVETIKQLQAIYKSRQQEG
ncbi:MAG: hypothetical protein BWY07_01991 [Candidatus Hydrogenedentes bacterium ADurb.Bin170]|nr:MAG: hypothetical protein BWY07_01991 [Candidatus Hydrogenedentes bacterium ADurb.Bin170]